MELNLKQKKEWAGLLFIRENLTQGEIADKVDISRQTISRWCKDGKWEEQRVGITLTREQQIANLHRQVSELNRVIAERPNGERFPNSKEADTLLKTATTINKLESESGLSDVISVGIRFLKHLRKADLSKAREYGVLWDSFVKESM